jgi:hypothetical protein
MNRLLKIAALNVATAAAPGAFSRRKAIAETAPKNLSTCFRLKGELPAILIDNHDCLIKRLELAIIVSTVKRQ